MKIFSIVAIVLGLIFTVFSIIDGNLLRIFSSIIFCMAFVFSFYHYKTKSQKFINLFIIFLFIYAVLSFTIMFTEKGYF